jgi:malate dehydrogenase (oxaloacetate-decarboxylating)
MMEMKDPKDVDLIVVTDSEGILGIGDQGVGGILISIGKGNIYTIGAGESPDDLSSIHTDARVVGIDPARILPVVLDLGTDNHQLLNDPLYLGLRRSRIRGAEYDEFLAQFCDIVRVDYPNAFLHMEDFVRSNFSFAHGWS